MQLKQLITERTYVGAGHVLAVQHCFLVVMVTTTIVAPSTVAIVKLVTVVPLLVPATVRHSILGRVWCRTTGTLRK